MWRLQHYWGTFLPPWWLSVVIAEVCTWTLNNSVCPGKWDYKARKYRHLPWSHFESNAAWSENECKGRKKGVLWDYSVAIPCIFTGSGSGSTIRSRSIKSFHHGWYDLFVTSTIEGALREDEDQAWRSQQASWQKWWRSLSWDGAGNLPIVGAVTKVLGSRWNFTNSNVMLEEN